MRDFFFSGCKQRCCYFPCYFQVSFCPVKRGSRAGPSRNESAYSRRGTQISFPLLYIRSCESLVLAPFPIVQSENWQLIKMGALFDQLFFSSKKIEQLQVASPKFFATATIEKRETGLGTSPRVVKLIPRRAGPISSLYGANTNRIWYDQRIPAVE